jgi:hypothetical protein
MRSPSRFICKAVQAYSIAVGVAGACSKGHVRRDHPGTREVTFFMDREPIRTYRELLGNLVNKGCRKG